MFAQISTLLKDLKEESGHRLFFITITACVTLTFIRFQRVFISEEQINNLLYHVTGWQSFKEWARLIRWALFSITGYVLFPVLFIILMKPSHRALGLKKIPTESISLYLLLSITMLSLVFVFSFNSDFQKTYPFYKYTDGGKFWWQGFVWELAYVLQFFALEFFFRGFLIHQTAPFLGKMSIYFSMVPYCMIHFSKPLPECIGSIFAGFILGWLSYKSKSIWGGIFLHVSVAISMDFLSALHQHL